jgi:WD40 repeat protein
MNRALTSLALLLAAVGRAGADGNTPKPSLVFESGGHTEPIWQLLFHPTKHRLISVSEDQTIRVWDYQEKRCVHVIRPPRGYGSSGKLLAADISPDGRLLAVAGNGYFVGETNGFVVPIYFIDLETGKLDGQPIILENIVFGLSFHKRLPVLAVASYDAQGVMLWDVSGKKRRLVGWLPVPGASTDGDARPGHVEFCPAGGSQHVLVGALLNGDVVRWEVNLRDPKSSKWAKLQAHTFGDTCVAWCRNGDLASCGADKKLQVYSPGGKQSWSLGLPAELLSVRPTGDAEFLITYGGGARSKFPHPQILSRDRSKRGWQYTNMLAPRGEEGGAAEGPNNQWFQAAAVSGGGAFAATSGNDNHEIIVWKLPRGERPEVYCRFGGEVEGQWTVAWAKDGSGFAFGAEPPRPNQPRVLDQGFDFKTFSVKSAKLDPDDYRSDLTRVLGRKEGKDSDDSTVTVETDPGRTVDVQVPKIERVLCAAVSAAAPRRLALGTQNDILVYDAGTGRLVVRLAGHRLDVRCVAFSPLDSNLLLSAGGDQRLYLWNLESRKEDYCGVGVSVSATTQGWRIAWLQPDGPAARSGRLEAGDVLEEFTDPDGRWIKLAGLPIQEGVYPMRGPENSKVRLRYWRPSTGRRGGVELTRKALSSEWPIIGPQIAFFFAGPEWVAATTNGYYRCSAGGERLMGWQVDRNLSELGTFLPAEAFRKSLYRPEVVQKMVTARSVKDALLQVDPRQEEVLQVGRIVPPRVRIVSPAPGEQNHGKVRVEARIEDLRDNTIEAVRLLVDHQAVSAPGKGATAPLAPAEYVKGPDGITVVWNDVPIHAGTQVIQAEVRTGNASEVSDPLPVRWGTAEKGDLYLLTFGTSTVPGGGFDWIPAKNDCEQIRAVFEGQTGPGKLYGSLAKQSASLIDDTATRPNLVKALARIQQSATSNDTVVVFISAHAAESAGRCLLISHDTDANELSSTAVPMADVKEYLANTKGRRLLLLDCCFAGNANTIKIENEIKEAKNNTGLILGCSCQSHQKAHDNCPVQPPRLSLFTYVVVKTFRGYYLEPKSGAVNLNDLEYYVKRNVVQHSVQFNSRQVPFFDYARDLDVLKINLVEYSK